MAFAECETLVVRTLRVAAFLGVSFYRFSSCLTFLERLLFPHRDQLHRPCRSGLYLSSYWLDIDSASQKCLSVLHAESLAQLGAFVNSSLVVIAAVHIVLGWRALSAFSDFDGIHRDFLQIIPYAFKHHFSILVCNCHSAAYIHLIDDSSSIPICTI